MELLQRVIDRKILLGGLLPFNDSGDVALASAKTLQNLLACSYVRHQALFLVLRATYVIYEKYNVSCQLDGISDCPENVHCEQDVGTFVTRNEYEALEIQSWNYGGWYHESPSNRCQ